jgi:quercetin dioxygenase-like cupin family protein
MFFPANPGASRTLLPGITLNTRAHGARTLLAEFRLQAGSRIPEHAHPHEQTGCVVTGRLRMVIAGKAYEAVPGDAWCIPADVPHAAHALEDTLALEVFTPTREDYLPAAD